MERRSNNGITDANEAPVPHTNGGASGLNPHLVAPDAMAAVMTPGRAFVSDPSLAAAAISDPPAVVPMAFSNNGGLALSDKAITADEIALYDRQIRLWGMAAQAKIQSANILLITIRALANEIAKNLVLAGIGSLTVLDDAAVAEADLGAQFLLSEVESPVGQNRAEAASAALRKLNPRVRIHVDSEGVKTKVPSYFANFDIVIATDLDPDSFNLINTATRLNGKAFYAAGTHGMYGFIFSDLIEHDYVIERDLGNVATELKQETRTRSIVDVKTKKEGPKVIESVTKRELYSTWFLASDVAGLPEEYTKSKRRLRSVTPTLSCLRALWEFVQIHSGRLPGNREDLKLFTQIATQKHKVLSLPGETLKPEFLRSFLQNLGSEIAPVAAILGGQLAQDVINVLGQKQQPIQNMVIFDGTTMEALMYPLHPEGILGASLLSLGGGVDTLVPDGGMMIPPDAPIALDGSVAVPPLDPTALARPQGMPAGASPAVTNADLARPSDHTAVTQADAGPVSMPAPASASMPVAGAGPAPPAAESQQQQMPTDSQGAP